MDSEDIAKQAMIEREMLGHIEQALRVVLGWQPSGGKAARKLSTLRFVGQSFQRHLDRLKVMDEHAGYMKLVVDAKPHLAATVETSKADRDKLQVTLDRVMLQMEHVSPDDSEKFDGLCEELSRFLDALTRHTQKERELFQEAFVREEGGSG